MRASSRFICIDGFAEEHEELIYEGISNWFISFRSPFTIYSAHFSYLVIFFSIISCGLLSYRHSIENGSKYTQFWWGALLHGVLSERSLTATKYWHAQAPIMFFGKQLPLHIVFFYPSILYLSMMAVHKLKLSICTEPAAVGLLAMLMEIPFRMISVKFLHITYHDTEPMYYHKLCGVPWVEIFSSLIFASSYVAVYHIVKYYDVRDFSSIWDRSQASKRETLITAMCGFSSPMVGFVQKLFLFHFLHDFFNINPISCLLFVVSVYLSFVVCFDLKKIEKSSIEESLSKTLLLYQTVVFLFCLLFLSLLGKPQNEVSIGRHEPTGDCTTLICSRTPLGKPVKRKKYLCTEEVAARKNYVYNFDCLEEGPPCLNAVWYTICGSPIHNRPQFFLNVLSFVILISTFFAKVLFSDVLKLESAKRLIVRFNRDAPQQEPEETSAREETTVGYVTTESVTNPFPSSLQEVKNEIT